MKKKGIAVPEPELPKTIEIPRFKRIISRRTMSSPARKPPMREGKTNARAVQERIAIMPAFKSTLKSYFISEINFTIPDLSLERRRNYSRERRVMK